MISGSVQANILFQRDRQLRAPQVRERCPCCCSESVLTRVCVRVKLSAGVGDRTQEHVCAKRGSTVFLYLAMSEDPSACPLESVLVMCPVLSDGQLCSEADTHCSVLSTCSALLAVSLERRGFRPQGCVFIDTTSPTADCHRWAKTQGGSTGVEAVWVVCRAAGLWPLLEMPQPGQGRGWASLQVHFRDLQIWSLPAPS